MGDGLGKDGQGVKTHVKVKKKGDNAGIGSKEHEIAQEQNSWWKNAFNSAAININVPGNSDSESDSESDSDDSDVDSDVDNKDASISLNRDMTTYTEEDIALFKRCGGRRCGKR